jgi:hypothetical protein
LCLDQLDSASVAVLRRRFQALLTAVLIALTHSGCISSSELVRTYTSGSSSLTLAPASTNEDIAALTNPLRFARSQSPGGAEGADASSTPTRGETHVPESAAGSPITVPNAHPVAESNRDPAARGAQGPSTGLSAAPAPTAAAAATNTQVPSGLSSISRNRLQRRIAAEEGLKYNYPDIHDDPARLYHERFGLEEDHDRFLFPSIMNLIFEDRWLLADNDATAAVQAQLRRRLRANIRDPDPDTANFPNGAYTLAKGRIYIENSPLGLFGSSKNSPQVYQWESLFRYGLTDNLEFRIFSNGLTVRGKQGKLPATTGYSPLAFDFKANFWEENTKYHIPAVGLEVYIQTTFGSPAFNSGTQPSMNLLFDQSLPLGINFEYNAGIAGVRNDLGFTHYQFSFQWSFQREVVKDFDIFFQGFYNESALPRTILFRDVPLSRSSIAQATIPTVVVAGAGAIWTVNDRLAIFGSYNFGLTAASPHTIALTGFAVAF